MECCSNEIQISFSPLELEVVRLAVKEFAHVETPETRSIIPSTVSIDVIRILNKLKFSPGAPSGEKSSNIPHINQMGDSFSPKIIFDLNRHTWFARLAVLFERISFHGWEHKKKRFKAELEGFDKTHVVSKNELEEIM